MISMYFVKDCYSQMADVVAASLETRVTECCEAPHGCRESNPGFLGEKPLFLTA